MPIARQGADPPAVRPRHIRRSHTTIPDRDRSNSSSFTSIDALRHAEPPMECDLLLNAVMNGVKQNNRPKKKEESTGLVMGLLGEDSSIARDRSATGALGTDRCLRCGGFTVAWCDNLVENAGRRCVQCGELVDPVILHNRRLQHTGTSSGVVMWSGKGTHA